MSGVNPQGFQVFGFAHPSAAELEHDFLWRTTQSLPERGRIGIFNRSYYEEVLIVRVHPEILRAQQLPDSPHNDKAVWQGRYRSILVAARSADEPSTRQPLRPLSSSGAGELGKSAMCVAAQMPGSDDGYIAHGS